MKQKRTTTFRGKNDVPLNVVAKELNVPYGVVYSRCANGRENGDDIENSPELKHASRRVLTEITREGETKTVRQWANDLGVSECAIRTRYARNGSLNTKNQRRGIRRIAIENGMFPSTLYARLRRGMSIEEAVGTPVKAGKPPETIEIDGKRKEVSQWMEESGVSRSLASYRIKNGWNVKDAVTTPPHQKVRPQNYEGLIRVVNGKPVLLIEGKEFTGRDLRAIAAQLRSMENDRDNENSGK